MGSMKATGINASMWLNDGPIRVTIITHKAGNRKEEGSLEMKLESRLNVKPSKLEDQVLPEANEALLSDISATRGDWLLFV